MNKILLSKNESNENVLDLSYYKFFVENIENLLYKIIDNKELNEKVLIIFKTILSNKKLTSENIFIIELFFDEYKFWNYFDNLVLDNRLKSDFKIFVLKYIKNQKLLQNLK